MARLARRGRRRPRDGRGPATCSPGSWSGRASRASACPRWSRPTTSTRSRPSRSRGSPATSTSSAASARYIRWNAVAMVDRANHRFDGLGGHLSTYASAAALYEVGFNHFFRGKGDGGFGDQVFFQGHAAPGIYAARVPRGPAHRGAARPVPPRGRRRRAPELPAPAAHARLLGVPDRLDGPRPAERGRPGPLQPLPAAPRDRRHERGEGVVLRRRRRDGRARVDGRPVDRGARAASTT